MITDVVDVHGFFFTVLHPTRDATNTGFTLSSRTQAGRVRQEGFQKLQGDNFFTLKLHRLDGRHADVTAHFQMLEVIIRARHPTACPLDLRKVRGNRLQLLALHQVTVLWTPPPGETERA